MAERRPKAANLPGQIEGGFTETKGDEPTLTLRVSQVLSTAVLARYLEI